MDHHNFKRLQCTFSHSNSLIITKNRNTLNSLKNFGSHIHTIYKSTQNGPLTNYKPIRSHFHIYVVVLHFKAEAQIFTFLLQLYLQNLTKKSSFDNFEYRFLSSTMITEYHRLLSGEPLATAFILCESLKQTKCTSVFPLG